MNIKLENKHRVVVICPDQETYYCYVDMGREDALKKFMENEDWARLYQPKGVNLENIDIREGRFDDSFVLFRNNFPDPPNVT